MSSQPWGSRRKQTSFTSPLPTSPPPELSVALSPASLAPKSLNRGHSQRYYLFFVWRLLPLRVESAFVLRSVHRKLAAIRVVRCRFSPPPRMPHPYLSGVLERVNRAVQSRPAPSAFAPSR